MTTRFVVDPTVSKIQIKARTSVGPVAWIGVDVGGAFTAVLLEDGSLDLSGPATGRIEVPMQQLRSGNRVYDGELLRRINARRHPTAVIELVGSDALTDTSVAAEATVTFHGAQRAVAGQLGFARRDDGGIDISGEQSIDIRDFGLPAPTMLMLKVYPDVRVALALVAHPA